jgi:hypothetical protein
MFYVLYTFVTYLLTLPRNMIPSRHQEIIYGQTLIQETVEKSPWHSVKGN